ncbi:PREDICTED: mitochondrial fission 1 protein [Vollenhovia emeryi]|uniref:mitochondrial fission 1 protein n=1 Tax=Vollenhovia emeryi TaxID=411798 RepID=UPI0005F55A7D|nr:PREDICTED: mitochondrial fission 1 protein [Vollenhovia emeryi]
MEDVLNEVVSSEDLKKFETVYNDQLDSSDVTSKAQFEYAWCLVRSKYSADIRKGIVLLEDLYSNSDSEKRDCLYYLAIGNARIKEYSKALSYVRAFLQIEPANLQVQQLESLIRKKMEKEGLMGIAVAGGVIIGIASILGLGIAMAKKN